MPAVVLFGDPDHVEMPRWLSARPASREIEARDVCECRVVAGGDLSTAEQKTIELSKLADSQGRLNVRHPVVEADVLHLLGPGAVLTAHPAAVALDPM